MSYVNCNVCGKRVSNDVVGPLVIRAFVQCPECLNAEPASTSDPTDADPHTDEPCEKFLSGDDEYPQMCARCGYEEQAHE